MFHHCLICERKTWIEGELCSACEKTNTVLEETGVLFSFATEEELELTELFNLDR